MPKVPTAVLRLENAPIPVSRWVLHEVLDRVPDFLVLILEILFGDPKFVQAFPFGLGRAIAGFLRLIAIGHRGRRSCCRWNYGAIAIVFQCR